MITAILVINTAILFYFIGKGKIEIKWQMSEKQFETLKHIEEERTKDFKNKASLIMNFQDEEFIK